MEKIIKRDHVLNEGEINPYLFRIYPELGRNVDIFEFDPLTQVFNPSRFDILLKYVLLNLKAIGYPAAFIRSVYYYHIKAFSDNTFREGDGRKKSFEDFEKAFTELEEKFLHGRFDGSSIIPFASKGPVDGSHRIALAAHYKVFLNGARIKDLRDPEYTHKWFENKQQPAWLNDFVFQKAIPDNENIRIVNVNPKCNIPTAKILELFDRYDIPVLYSTTIKLNIEAFHILTAEYYIKENWIGTPLDNYRGARKHAENAFAENGKLRCFFVNCSNLELLRQLKNEIRARANIGNYAVHINDSFEETVRLSQLYLNAKSIEFLNEVTMNRFFHWAVSLINEYKQSSPLASSDHLVISGSFGMVMTGLRKSNDIDLLGPAEIIDELSSRSNLKISQHNSYLESFDFNVKDLVYDPRNYFYFKGVKILTIDRIMELKLKRREKKDIKDLIKFFKNKYVRKLKVPIVMIPFRLVNRVRQKLKNTLLKSASSFLTDDIKLRVKYAIGSKNKLLKLNKSALRYPSGYSIMERYFQDGNAYETALIDAITKRFQNNRDIAYIDVGANIGLFCALLLDRIDVKKAFLFEPGQFQFRYLEKNFAGRKNFFLYNLALGDTDDLVPFAVHHPIHSSGDGVIDTRRAGKVKMTMVKQLQLDRTGIQDKADHIDFIKIDVEGYEYFVLRGGKNLITQFKPVIYLEINKENLKVQKFDFKDLYNLVTDLNYQLFDLKLNSIDDYQYIINQTDDNYIALPR